MKYPLQTTHKTNFLIKKKQLIQMFLLIVAFQVSAGGKNQQNFNDSLIKQLNYSPEFVKPSLNALRNDIIFTSGFEPVPVILSFNADPEIIGNGGSTNLTWTLVNNATMCVKSGNWSGMAAFTNGIHSETISNITTSSTYQLQCSNSFGDSQLVSVTVDPVPAFCINQPPILVGDEDRSIVANGTIDGDTYNGRYTGFQAQTFTPDWPGFYGDTIQLTLTANKYISALFTTNFYYDRSHLQFIEPSNFEGTPPTNQTISISECPGDFTVHLNQPQCLSTTSQIRWSTGFITGPGLFCKLATNSRYYLNIVHSDSSENNNYSTSDCNSSSCGILATQVLEASTKNIPPVISEITIPAFLENTPSEVVNFTIADLETIGHDLIVTGVSSNESIVMNTNIIFTGNGSNRSVQIIPNTNANTQSANVTITITVSDGLNFTPEEVSLTIIAVD